MPLHKNLIDSDIHVVHAFTFADATARNAVEVVTSDVGKIAKQNDNDTYYILKDTIPTWIQIDSGGFDTFLELTDTPANFTGDVGKVVEVNTGETALQFGQALLTTSNPTFANLVLTGDLTIQGTNTTIDTTTLLVEDKNIEIGNVTTPTDVTADGGGITLKGTTDKTITWLNATNRWTFNQDIDLLGNNLFSTGILTSDTLIATTSVLAGNLQLSGNTLSPTNANGDIILAPIGTGDVSISSNTIIGSTSVNPDGALHVHVGSSGAVTASSVANALVVEDSTNNGLSILTPDASVGRIIFGSPSDPFGAFMAWSFSGSDFTVGSSKIGANFRLTSDQETTNLTLSGGAGSELATFAKDVNVSESLTATQVNADNLRLELNTITNTDGVGGINLITNGGNVLILTDKVAVQGTSIGDTGPGSEYIKIRDDRTTVTSAPNYILGIMGQSNNIGVLFLGNDGNGDAIIVTGDNDLRIGNDVAGAFTENIRFASGGNVGIGVTDPDAKLEIAGQIKITGGNPGNSKYLRSDADGLATWGDVGWTDLGTDVVLLDNSNNVGIGTPAPDTKLHVENGGTAGTVTPFVDTIATFESPGDGFLSILTPDAGIRGILFGEPSSNIAGGIFYNDPGSPDGFQFRVNGNVTKMVIENDGRVGIGTTNPDITSILHLNSTTKGFLPPRMTTAQRDAISSPLAGLKIHNTTVDKSEVFTGTSWKTVLTEDLGTFVVQETFASTNVRFFGEFGIPQDQGWTDTATGIATIDLVTQTVFGEVKQVVRHNDDTGGGSTTSKITLTAQNWIDINDFGASYSGTARLDTVNGASGFFSGLQANAAENPLATGNRRYGILFASDSGNLKLIEADNNPGNSVIMDGTGGNPLIPFDEWFRWECVIPAGLGAAQVFINGILTTFVPIFIVNGGGLGTQVIVSSGSTGGANRIAYHDNFGTTIFEESATRTLAAATMVATTAQVNIPEGKRDYTIILPDGNPRPIGSLLRLVANNQGGLVSLQNENPAVPEILYNGLRTLVLNITIKEVIDGVNTVNSGNVYIGFKAEDVDRSSSIFAQLHSIIDQIPADVNPTVITYTNHDSINGIGHSTTLNTGELEILPGFEGTYFIMAQPQVGKDTGGTKVDFDMFLQVDRNGEFVDEPNSNIKLTIKDSDITDVIVSAITIQLQVGEKIRMMQAVSNAAVGMGLKNTDPVVGPPTVPRTPSIIFTMYRIGGI